ncbi:DUF4349 domain-containing protein, partial [Streptomyces calidiresistens]
YGGSEASDHAAEGGATDEAGGFPEHLPDEGDGAGAIPAPEREAPEAEPDEAVEDGAHDVGGADDVDGGDSAAVPPELRGTHLIRTAHLVVLTGDVRDAWSDAVDVAERVGGFVASEWSDRDREGRERSRLTLRVPPERYDEVLVRLSELGEVAEREVSTEDVTGQVVDVAARIATQEESVARVRALMEEAESLRDVVTLESELSSRQAELEALKARYASLRERTGMGTVTVELREPGAEEMEEEREPGAPSPLGALEGGWGAFLLTLGWIAAALGAVLPFAVTLALLWLGWRLWRSRRPERTRREPAVPVAAGAVPPPPAAPPATGTAPAPAPAPEKGSVEEENGGSEAPGSGDGDPAPPDRPSSR